MCEAIRVLNIIVRDKVSDDPFSRRVLNTKSKTRAIENPTPKINIRRPSFKIGALGFLGFLLRTL